MSELDAVLRRLGEHGGVDHLILLGRDGLVIQHIGVAGTEEPMAARIPGLAVACTAIGNAGGSGDFATAVLEFDRGVTIVTALSGELFLVAMVRPGVGFAPLLRDLRRERARLLEFF